MALGVNASFSLPAALGGANITVGLDRLSLDGIDTLTAVRLLDVPADGAPGAAARSLIGVVTPRHRRRRVARGGDGISGTAAAARVAMRADATNLTLDVDGTLALNWTALLDVPLASLASPGSALPCLLSLLADLSARELNLSMLLALGAAGRLGL